MPILKAQVTIPDVNGVTADDAVNSFYVEQSGAPDNTLYLGWEGLLSTFYTDISSYTWYEYDTTALYLKIYDAQGVKPNYPLYENTFAGGPNLSSNPLPREVALAISYKNVTSNVIDRKNRRGRIYMGGVGESYNELDGRPTEALCQGLRDAFKNYVTAVRALPSAPLPVIFSPATFGAYPIEEVRVDNEWDTQRRRGRKATQVYTTGVF